jgi:polygalacturonase
MIKRGTCWLLIFLLFSFCEKRETSLDEDLLALDYEIYTPNLINVYAFYKESLTHSEIIEKAIVFSKDIENRTLVFDTIDWYIDRAIQLPSNTTVLIDGVAIKQNDFVFDNVFRGDNLRIDPKNPNGVPLEIEALENIKILGFNGAKIIGCDVNATIFNNFLGEEQEAVGDYYGWRTLQISLTNCIGIEISGIKFSQTRSWCISIDKSSAFEIHDLVINSDVKNGDGIDVRNACHDFKIYNVTGNTSDDLVALTTLATKLDLSDRPQMYPMVPSSLILKDSLGLEGGIYNGEIKNIKKSGRYHAVIVLASGGKKIENIRIDGVQETKARTREALVRVYTGYGGGYSAGDISGININNVKGIGNYSKGVVSVNASVVATAISNVSSLKGNEIFLDDDKGITVINSNYP